MRLFEYRPGKGSVGAGTARECAGLMKVRSSRRRHSTLLETLEHRTLLSITSINVNVINPTEGTPLGSAFNPAQIGTFDVNNYTGIDESSEYSAVIYWGDGSQSAGLGPVTIQFVADLGNGNAEYGVYNFHTYALATTSSNPDTLTISVADNTGPGTVQAQSGSVQVNSAPLQNSYTPATINATIGVPLTNVTIGQLIDTNPLAVAGNYAVSVNWGDGQFSSGTVVPYKTSTELSGAGVEFTIEASHTYTSGGSFTAAALISEIGGAQLTETTPITVTGSPLQQVTAAPIAAVVGVPFTGTVASFTDPNPSDTASEFSATINWGDGDSTAGTVESAGSGAFIVTAISPVSGNGYAYPNVGTYNVTISVTGPNSTKFTAFTTATVADAPLSASAIQPTVSTTEATVFTGPVASFTSANPAETVGDFNYVTIDWGDGTPLSLGMVTQPAGVGTAFLVSGTHTYASAGVNGGIGHYPITVAVHDVGGSTLNIANTADVADVPLIVTGKLNPASDSGESDSDDITSVVQPKFIGTTNQPNASVTLYATVSGGTPVLIGQGVSNANDAWSITSDQALATGTYVITAIAIDQYGHTVSSDTTIVPNLVIDTVPPVISAATFDRFDDTVTVTYQGNLSGLDYASIGNGAFYHLSATPLSAKVPVPKELLPTAITITPAASPTAPVTVNAVFNHGHAVRGGSYLIVIDSGTGDNGVQDVAGSALDGNFYGTFPTGDGLAGGNFAAAISTFHNDVTLAPVPVRDGYVAPGAVTIDPPSSVAKTAKKVRLVESKAGVKLVIQPAKQANVHDLAMWALTFDKKAKRDQS